MYVTRFAIAHWENGSRLPDAAMIYRLSEVLGVEVNVLLNAAAQSDDHPNVIMVDDNKVIPGFVKQSFSSILLLLFPNRCKSV